MFMKQPLNFLNDIEAVVFDVYDTIVEINDKRAPYKKLFRLLAKKGRVPLQSDAAQLMTTPADLFETAKLFGYELSEQELFPIQTALESEISSISVYPDALETLQALKNAGLKLGLCSNLALPYANPIMRLLPISLDAYVWSFDGGAIKPDPKIYLKVCDALDLEPTKILFVGDTLLADYIGPRSVGMNSVHLCRKGTPSTNETVNSLTELLVTL